MIENCGKSEYDHTRCDACGHDNSDLASGKATCPQHKYPPGTSETPSGGGSVSNLPTPPNMFRLFENEAILVLRDSVAIKLFCLWALDLGLYTPGRMLSEIYTKPENVEILAAMFIDGVPIGNTLMTRDKFATNFSVFVRPEHRRKKYGTRLVQAIRPHIDRPIYVSTGEPHVDAFWAHVNMGG